MKILHVVNAFTAGGMENGISNLTRGLYEKGLSCDICVLTKADGFAERLHPSVKLFLLDRQTGFDPGIWIRIAEIISRNNYDVIHTHNWTGLIYGVPSGLWCGVPVLHGEHSELFEWEKHPVRLAIRRLFYRWCRIVHVISTAQLNQLDKFGLIQTVEAFAISNGTDTDKFSPQNTADSRSMLGLPEDVFLIGIVGRLVATKRHRFLLDSFIEIASKIPNAHLAIIGSGGDLEKVIHSECEQHIFSERIHWLGARNDMPSIYNALTMLVIPSVNEGMTNVALEAMACGIPVIANQACGISQIVDHQINGLVYPMNDPSVFADFIVKVAADQSALAGLGERARIKMVERFSLEAMMEEYARVYSTVCMRRISS
jgi:glycosyltransferase involved in cell wall biosynthesis